MTDTVLPHIKWRTFLVYVNALPSFCEALHSPVTEWLLCGKTVDVTRNKTSFISIIKNCSWMMLSALVVSNPRSRRN